MVPTLAENCLAQPLALHFHRRRVARNPTFLEWHLGQTTPLGHFIPATKWSATSGSEKNLTASSSVSGCRVAMREVYPQTHGESSILLPLPICQSVNGMGSAR